MDRIANILVCALIIAAMSLSVKGSLLGRKPGESAQQAPEANAVIERDGFDVVSSVSLSGKTQGFGGQVDVEVHFKDGKVASVSPILPNDETPMFFNQLGEGFWNAWNGLSAMEAAVEKVDAVTGATYSSRAAIASVRLAAAEYAKLKGAGAPSAPAPDVAAMRISIAAVYLAILATVPLFSRSRRLRIAILVLDVAILGLFSGFYLSSARILGWAASGLQGGFWSVAAAVLVLAMAFVYPLFGRKSHYCMQACPFGAAQELAGMCLNKKPSMPQWLVKALSVFRILLWGVLVFAAMAGFGGKWLAFELLGFFAWDAVPHWLLAAAAVVLLLSVFVPRPYCRFACPTGSFFKLAESDGRETLTPALSATVRLILAAAAVALAARCAIVRSGGAPEADPEPPPSPSFSGHAETSPADIVFALLGGDAKDSNAHSRENNENQGDKAK